MAINTLCSIPKSTPSRMLEILLGVMPLDLFIEREGTKTFVRLRKVLEFGWDGKAKRKTLATSHMKFWEEKTSMISGWEDENDKIKRVVWNRRFKVDLESFKKTNNCLLYTSPSPRDS